MPAHVRSVPPPQSFRVRVAAGSDIISRSLRSRWRPMPLSGIEGRTGQECNRAAQQQSGGRHAHGTKLAARDRLHWRADRAPRQGRRHRAGDHRSGRIHPARSHSAVRARVRPQGQHDRVRHRDRGRQAQGRRARPTSCCSIPTCSAICQGRQDRARQHHAGVPFARRRRRARGRAEARHQHGRGVQAGTAQRQDDRPLARRQRRPLLDKP